jgi:hypothetical protein
LKILTFHKIIKWIQFWILWYWFDATIEQLRLFTKFRYNWVLAVLTVIMHFLQKYHIIWLSSKPKINVDTIFLRKSYTFLIDATFPKLQKYIIQISFIKWTVINLYVLIRVWKTKRYEMENIQKRNETKWRLWHVKIFNLFFVFFLNRPYTISLGFAVARKNKTALYSLSTIALF